MAKQKNIIDYNAFVRECWFATYNSGSWSTIAPKFKLTPKTVGSLIEKLRKRGVDMPYNLRENIPAYNPKKSFRNGQLERMQSSYLAKIGPAKKN